MENNFYNKKIEFLSLSMVWLTIARLNRAEFLLFGLVINLWCFGELQN